MLGRKQCFIYALTGYLHFFVSCLAGRAAHLVVSLHFFLPSLMYFKTWGCFYVNWARRNVSQAMCSPWVGVNASQESGLALVCMANWFAVSIITWLQWYQLFLRGTLSACNKHPCGIVFFWGGFKKKAPVSFLLVKASYHVIATLLTSCTIKGTLWIISGLLLW